MTPPTPSSSPPLILGRRSEEETLWQWLEAQSPERLFSLVGPPGVGKTHLAKALLFRHQARCRRPEHASFSDLSRSRSLQATCDAVSQALHIPSLALRANDLPTGIARWLQSWPREALLVLDNVEQILDSTRDLISLWLSAAPHLRVLVTSRSPLDLPFERVLHLQPLAVPKEDASESDLMCSPSVQLFWTATPAHWRARTPQSLPLWTRLARISRALEGLPLALELAAARLEVMSIQDVEEQIAERMRLLRNPSSPVTERHSTLWHAIDWSWNLLSAHEQHIMAALSIFSGSFDWRSARAIVDSSSPESFDANAPDTLDCIQSLCRKNLLLRIDGDPPRFRFYESIRAYARTHLDRTQRHGLLAARHRAHFAARAESYILTCILGDADDPHALTRSLDDLQTAAQHALACLPHDPTAPADLCALLTAISQAYLGRGANEMHLNALNRAVDALGQGASPSILNLTHLLRERGQLMRYLGRPADSLRDLSRALSIAQLHNDLPLQAIILGNLAEHHYLSSHLDQARELNLQSLALAVRCNMLKQQAIVTCALGLIAQTQGLHPQAHDHYQHALSILRPLQNQRWLIHALSSLGSLLLELNQPAQARAHFDEALTLLASGQDPRKEAVVTGYLGILDHLQGRLSDARSRYLSIIDTFERLHDPRFCAYYQIYLGMLSLELDPLAPPVALTSGLKTLETLDDPRFSGIALAALAASASLRADLPCARDLLSQADAHLRACGDPLVLHVLDAYAGLISLCEHTDALSRNDFDAARLHLASARSALALASSSSLDDARLASRPLQARLHAIELGRSCWLIHPDGVAFRAPDHDLWTPIPSASAARILSALTRAHLEQPHTFLPSQTLISIGWPNDQSRWKTATNRLYVALSHLRKAGLHPLLEHTPQSGYRLNPTSPILSQSADPTTPKSST